MNWNDVVQRVTPYVVKIETPQGHGTGFVCFYTDEDIFCAIATALHVVAHADRWQEPLRIHHHPSNTTVLLREHERFIFADPQRDSAVMLVERAKLPTPKQLIPLRPIEDRLPIGAEVGWLGYPAVTLTLCFFAGNISAVEEWRHSYLIDGVAISGVSGGPVVFAHATDGVQIVGSISAYMANRATGEVLPGLSVAKDVSHYHQVYAHVKSQDEARKKQAEEAAKAQPAAPPTEPPPVA